MKKNIICSFFVLVLVLSLTTCASSASEDYDSESVGENVPQDKVDIEITDSFADQLNPDRDYQIIVNDKNPYDFHGEYAKELKDDIVYMADYDGVPRPLEKATYSAFAAFKKKISEYNIDVALVSGYRDKTEQEMVNEGYYTDLPEGKIEFEDSVTPGYSEFHSGLLLLFAIKDDEGKWSTDESLTKDTTYDVVWEELENYGFVVRYPEGKESITETPYDPFVIRFLGDSGFAHELVKNDECMEEYF